MIVIKLVVIELISNSNSDSNIDFFELGVC